MWRQLTVFGPPGIISSVVIKMASLAECHQVFVAVVGRVVVQVCSGQHNPKAGDRVGLKVLSPTCFTFTTRPLKADPVRYALPVRRI